MEQASKGMTFAEAGAEAQRRGHTHVRVYRDGMRETGPLEIGTWLQRMDERNPGWTAYRHENLTATDTGIWFVDTYLIVAPESKFTMGWRFCAADAPLEAAA